jgi:deoxyribose-phosphate aldolase
MAVISKKELSSMIDHTILKAVATEDMVRQLCSEARENSFASVCVNPCFVRLAASELKGSDVKVCTVIGFPLGANTTALKAFEAENAVEEGADEIDMVINIGAMKEGRHQYVEDEIRKVVAASKGALVKVIIETCYLTDDEKKAACQAAANAGADFVKTSTGFGTGGATAADVALMRSVVGENMGVKASGGIRTLKDALEMIEAGANRLGVSASLAILEEI